MSWLYVGFTNRVRWETALRYALSRVMILDVLPGSQAARAGLRSEDVVISVNGVEVETPGSELMLQFGLGAVRIGDTARGAGLVFRG